MTQNAGRIFERQIKMTFEVLTLEVFCFAVRSIFIIEKPNTPCFEAKIEFYKMPVHLSLHMCSKRRKTPAESLKEESKWHLKFSDLGGLLVHSYANMRFKKYFLLSSKKKASFILLSWNYINKQLNYFFGQNPSLYHSRNGLCPLSQWSLHLSQHWSFHLSRHFTPSFFLSHIQF